MGVLCISTGQWTSLLSFFNAHAWSALITIGDHWSRDRLEFIRKRCVLNLALYHAHHHATHFKSYPKTLGVYLKAPAGINLLPFAAMLDKKVRIILRASNRPLAGRGQEGVGEVSEGWISSTKFLVKSSTSRVGPLTAGINPKSPSIRNPLEAAVCNRCSGCFPYCHQHIQLPPRVPVTGGGCY